MKPNQPTSQPPWHPCVRKRFFIRRHPTWGRVICWHQWNPAFSHWCIAWGPSSKTIPEAKRLRRFLNEKVARWPSDSGWSFEKVVGLVISDRAFSEIPTDVIC